MKRNLIFVFFFISICILHGTPLFSHVTIEDYILYETIEIQEAEEQGSTSLAGCYINRAESYMVSGKFNRALEDLEIGCEIASQFIRKMLSRDHCLT